MEFFMPEYTVDYEVNKFDPYSRLSEGMKRVIDWQNAHAKDAFDTNFSWEQVRANYVAERRFWNEGGPEPYKTVETTVEGPVGPVPVRLYYPTDAQKHYAVVFIHGGGFTLGNNDTHDRMMRCVMESSGCVVIGVDYHLAPEYKFPTQLYECAAVARYFHENAEEWGIYGDKIALCGDSGGGVLSLSTNLYLRDAWKDNSYIAALLLFYPGIGLDDGISRRMEGSILDGMRRCDLAAYGDSYSPPGMDPENPYKKIVNADLTHGMPPTYICCGDMDPLLDDCRLLKIILAGHGVRVELEEVPGVLHAYMHYSRMMDEAVDCLRHSGEFYKSVLEG